MALKAFVLLCIAGLVVAGALAPFGGAWLATAVASVAGLLAAYKVI